MKKVRNFHAEFLTFFLLADYVSLKRLECEIILH